MNYRLKALKPFPFHFFIGSKMLLEQKMNYYLNNYKKSNLNC
jgi:hypothetical protein